MRPSELFGVGAPTLLLAVGLVLAIVTVGLTVTDRASHGLRTGLSIVLLVVLTGIFAFDGEYAKAGVAGTIGLALLWSEGIPAA